jgi:hypothetical protein
LAFKIKFNIFISDLKDNNSQNNNTSNAIANQALQKKSEGVSLEAPIKNIFDNSNSQSLLQKKSKVAQLESSAEKRARIKKATEGTTLEPGVNPIAMDDNGVGHDIAAEKKSAEKRARIKKASEGTTLEPGVNPIAMDDNGIGHDIAAEKMAEKRARIKKLAEGTTLEPGVSSIAMDDNGVGHDIAAETAVEKAEEANEHAETAKTAADKATRYKTEADAAAIKENTWTKIKANAETATIKAAAADTAAIEAEQAAEKANLAANDEALKGYQTEKAEAEKAAQKAVEASTLARSAATAASLAATQSNSIREKIKPNADKFEKFELEDGEAAASLAKLKAQQDDALTSSASKKADKIAGINEKTTGTATAITGGDSTGTGDALLEKNTTTDSAGTDAKTNNTKIGKEMGIASDTSGVFQIINLAKIYNNLKNPDTKGLNKVAVIADGAKSIANIAESSVKTTKNIKTEIITDYKDGGESKIMGSVGSGFEAGGALLGGIKSAIEGIMAFSKLQKEKEDNSAHENNITKLNIAISGLDTMKSIMVGSKAVWEAIEQKVAGGMIATLPGADIIISAAKIVRDYLKFREAKKQAAEMDIAQENTIANDVPKEEAAKASEHYRKLEAGIANKNEVVTELDIRISKAKTSSEISALKTRKAAILLAIDRNKTLITQPFLITLKDKTTKKLINKKDIEEFSLVKEIKESNDKRVTRQGIHIASELVKIGGSIATLTGVGALAGGVIKGAAAAGDLALPAVRAGKQYARNRAAHKEAEGKTGFFDRTGNADTSKSTAAKEAYRIQKAKDLYNMIGALAAKDPENVDDKKEVAKVMGYIDATGINSKKLLKKTPQEGFQMIVESFSSRE